MSKNNSIKRTFIAAIYRFETLRNLFNLEYPVNINWLMKEYNLSLWDNDNSIKDIEISVKLFMLTYCKYIKQLDKQHTEPADIGFTLPDYKFADHAIFTPSSIGSKLHLRVRLFEYNIRNSIILENPLTLETQEENDAVAILSNQDVSQEHYYRAVEYLKQRFGAKRVSYMTL